MDKYKKFFIEFFDSFKQALVVFALLYIFLWPMGIDGISMEPNLYNEDRVFISRTISALGFIDRGDICVIKPEIAGMPKYLVKRLIALPGDRLTIKNGEVYINNELMVEDYTNSGETFGDIDIFLENGQYYFIGDNRSNSNDSRNFGIMHKNNIVGKVILRWYPINRIKAY